MPKPDLHLVRRAQVARAVKIGKAVGYGCFALACIAFGFIWLDKQIGRASCRERV